MMTKKKLTLVAKWRSALTGNDAERFRRLEARFPRNFAEAVLDCETAFWGSGSLLCKWMDDGMDGRADESGRKLFTQAIQDCPHEFFEHLSGIMEDWAKISGNEEMRCGFAVSMRTNLNMRRGIDTNAVSVDAAVWLFLAFFEEWSKSKITTK